MENNYVNITLGIAKEKIEVGDLVCYDDGFYVIRKGNKYMDNNFKIGDRVEVNDIGWVYPTHRDMAYKLGAVNWVSGYLPLNGVMGRIKNIIECYVLVQEECGNEFIINKQGLKKIGGNMSLYDDLKSRIEKLNNGWDKEADDILEQLPKGYQITIVKKDNNECWVNAYSLETGHGNTTYYKSQCQKMAAFKDALLWLLGNSSIKKDERQEKIEQLESKMRAIQSEIEGLKKG